jgi:nitrate/TMAO reductase-like tetraheme cytochrome c subunit/ribosomal protein S27E
MNNQDRPLEPLARKVSLIRNPLSLIGAALAATAVATIVFLLFVDLVSARPSPYVGVLLFMVAPGFLIMGVFLVIVGMLLERRRRRIGAPAVIPRFPRLDLNVPAQRNTFTFFVSSALVFVLISAIGSYRSYEFTDSVQFCGQTCHTVMRPEYTTYLQSPHARVACVQCHVGPGAGWYVRSKLSGSYQVYAAIFHKYPRPIPTPISNLRPAQQTCEQCHWPRKFYGAQLKVFYHFGDDEKNTPRQIRMLINTGGAQPNTGLPAGIHWHMNIENRITYIATDAQHQVIPWVQARDMQGRITVYSVKDSTLTKEQIDKSTKHLMDCIDCHDRPSHIFTPPDRSVDDSLIAGRIDQALPFIKQQGVTELTKTYNSTDEALRDIDADVQKFYKTSYPQVYANHKAEIQAAISDLQHIYQSTIFPYMKVDWRTHPNNIGHFYSLGCFRCHDGQHVSADGKVIPKDCNTCHTVLAESQSGVALIRHEVGVPFEHPIDIGDLTQVNCNDCHTGGVGP